MLRFPLNSKVILITTAGHIVCRIIRATNEFLFCKDVVFDGMSLDDVYVNRTSVVAFSNIVENESKEKETLENKIQQACRIVKFNEKRG